MNQFIWLSAIILISFVTYLLSYLRFRQLIATQTKQMIQLMKAEESDFAKINHVLDRADEDFADLERAALGLRKKYLRLKKQSREESTGYETVFSGLKEAIVTVDQNLKIISFNAAFLNHFRWAPLENQMTYFLQDAIRDPGVIKTFKTTLETATAQRIEGDDLQLFVTPLPSRIENQTWCLGVFYDLSEIRKTEKMRIDFVANASHELRTPLTVIKGYSELLLKKINSEKKTDWLELVLPLVESSESMTELMDDLLNLSKLDLSSTPNTENISTAEVTQDILQELESIRQLNGKIFEIHNNCATVFASRDSLMQILRNLLVNAIKYSGASEKILITWHEHSRHTVLKIKDFGPGIPRQHQDRIFERFYRIDKGRGRDQGGSGLGLALVKHHMLNHQGRISVVSEPGQGSEFICEFPHDFQSNQLLRTAPTR